MSGQSFPESRIPASATQIPSCHQAYQLPDLLYYRKNRSKEVHNKSTSGKIPEAVLNELATSV
jgi:hypothetical protein